MKCEQRLSAIRDRRSMGVGFVGAGRMGTQRASVAAMHAAVRFMAVADTDADRARFVADKVGAQFSSVRPADVIEHPDVDVVVVSTPEYAHAEPVIHALSLGKPVLVEKPLALTSEDARAIEAAVAEHAGDLFIGYTKRFTRSYVLAKEYINRGCLGRTLGGHARVYNSRAQAFQILKRSAHATPVLDVLTYYVDLIGWFLEGNEPVEVVARGQKGVFHEAGYSAEDLTWALLTFADGAVVNLGVDYALPEKYPSMGQSPRIELLGTEGVLLLDEEHREHLLYTNKGVRHGYVPGHDINLAFIGTSSSGDFALGDFWGPQADETRSWLDYLATGRPCILPRAAEARRTVEVTLAIEEAVKTRAAIALQSAPT